jgi:predicted methyltransferase
MTTPLLLDQCIAEQPAGVPVLDAASARALLAARKDRANRAVVSLDLGLSAVEVVINDDGLSLPDDDRLSWNVIAEIEDGGERCYAVEDGEAWAVGMYSDVTGWYRSLISTGGTPTTLVGGFTMHRIKGTDPLVDTREKIRAIQPVTGRVLDTATGLGYTAIEASRSADAVVTVELDPAAIEIARYNPWSRELFERETICIILADVGKLVEDLEDGSFDRIIHDPPTMSLAGELYSEAFYRELYRLLARRGRLFHYIGDPESRSAGRLTDGVIRRLQAAGFERVRRAPRAFGVVAYR